MDLYDVIVLLEFIEFINESLEELKDLKVLLVLDTILDELWIVGKNLVWWLRA